VHTSSYTADFNFLMRNPRFLADSKSARFNTFRLRAGSGRPVGKPETILGMRRRSREPAADQNEQGGVSSPVRCVVEPY
jgi:hypothetical protein